MIIALDSSTLTLSLALLRRTADGSLEAVAEASHGPPQRQSELLPGTLTALLDQAELGLRDIQAIAVGLGPGSFTGLRVGLATAKGMAYAMGWKLAGASSLAAIALEGPENRMLVPTAVARQGHFYIGQYRRTGTRLEIVEPEREISGLHLAAMLREREGLLAIGPGIAAHQEFFTSQKVPIRSLSPTPAFPKATAVARLSPFPTSDDVNALFALEPHYLRPSAAEENPAFPPVGGPPPTAQIRDD